MPCTEISTVHKKQPPCAVRKSELMQAGGFAVFTHFPGADAVNKLLAEARLRVKGAVATAVATPDGEEVRGGSPARSFISAGGGPVQAALYHSPDLNEFVAGLCNTSVQPTGEGGTYTYYARPGDHLALHRDIETCDISVITCLLDRHPEGSGGGVTCCYPGRQHEPLSSVRATPFEGAEHIRLTAGSTMVIFGGLVPHLIEPIGEGELRIVSILCFRVPALG